MMLPGPELDLVLARKCRSRYVEVIQDRCVRNQSTVLLLIVLENFFAPRESYLKASVFIGAKMRNTYIRPVKCFPYTGTKPVLDTEEYKNVFLTLKEMRCKISP